MLLLRLWNNINFAFNRVDVSPNEKTRCADREKGIYCFDAVELYQCHISTFVSESGFTHSQIVPKSHHCRKQSKLRQLRTHDIIWTVRRRGMLRLCGANAQVRHYEAGRSKAFLTTAVGIIRLHRTLSPNPWGRIRWNGVSKVGLVILRSRERAIPLLHRTDCCRTLLGKMRWIRSTGGYGGTLHHHE